ncbi:MAG: hypothetical protein AAF802_22205 [Planctomycetota bacterium]
MLASVFLACCVVSAESPAIPTEVKAQMLRMIGDWTFEGKDGDRGFSGEETVRMINAGTALLQQGFFDLGEGEKERYTILSCWDEEKKLMRVLGGTSEGITWDGDWKTVEGEKWIGTASGKPASFSVKKDSMRYEESGEGPKWISNFTRKK